MTHVKELPVLRTVRSVSDERDNVKKVEIPNKVVDDYDDDFEDDIEDPSDENGGEAENVHVSLHIYL